MKELHKKLIILGSIAFFVVVGLAIIFSFNKKPSLEDFDKANADVLEIENIQITNIASTSTRKDVTTKIKNKVDDTISDVSIVYDELDEKENKIHSNKVAINVSLKKDEKAVVSIIPQNYTNTVNIIGYNYNTENYSVYVDLNNNQVSAKVIENDEDQKREVLSLSKLEKIDDTSYLLRVKNLSDKNLGNIILKVAELNSENEYISVNNVSYNNILKEKEETEIMLNGSEQTVLEVIGYSYDDMQNKVRVDVDLKSHNASILKN